ncbi:MAG: GNAT family N-acetyltransferase [Candidatus Calescibacterium sp.]|nr:GNAT family N-acetyltransferase [Candidatus Calescibacterium sp.]MCX7758618.1 GNAT family N-acetyltransferase [bacterium]
MIKIEKADISFKKDIKNLYYKVYGSFYSLPEIIDDELMEEILLDDNNCWVVARDGNDIIGSLIFRVSKSISLAKALGAIVMPSHRGKGIFGRMFEFGLNFVDTDIIYALTRTISPEPQKLLLRYNFVPLGIFPNVRRVYAYENHGLYALIKPEAFKLRRKINNILPEIKNLLAILKDIMIRKFLLGVLKDRYLEYSHLEPFISEKYDIVYREKFGIDPKEAKKVDIKVINVEKDYFEVYDKLRFKFFPFHKPNFKISTEFGSVFLHLNMIDKHCAIMGIDTKREDLERVYNLFFNIPYIVDKLDARYLEIVSMTPNYFNHSVLLDNGFIPAAYFPCLIPERDKNNIFRTDAVIFFYPYNLPHFKKMFVPEDFKPYIKYVYSMIIRKINEELDLNL